VLGAVFAIAAVVVIAAVIWFLVRRSASSGPGKDADAAPRTHPAPPVAEFHVGDGTATVSFDVPLPEGEVDEVLRDLLVYEAVEVVREKRHHLPIDDVARVVAQGRRGGAWHPVGSISLETPGELPPPAAPVVIPGLHGDRAFDPFEKMSELPEHAPGLSERAGSDTLGRLGAELRIPASLEAGLRSQGIDPAIADAGELVIGILRLTGSAVTERGADTYEAIGAGHRTMVRVVPHGPDDHPELDGAEVRRFAADFATSGADRALLITEKYSPFEVYDRERRDPRARYITRERVQNFIDALALG
jgi:hypothetical protein